MARVGSCVPGAACIREARRCLLRLDLLTDASENSRTKVGREYLRNVLSAEEKCDEYDKYRHSYFLPSHRCCNVNICV